MEETELIKIYPRLWHMAEDGSWPSISQYGLCSTSALLDRYQIKGQRRFEIESCHRRDCVTIAKSGLPDAIIRDQKPMSDSALRKCLEPGMSPQQWYEMLNRNTFFWLSHQRLCKLLGARAYRDRPHTVLTVRTESLLASHAARISLSRINSGSTLFNAPLRGHGTFLPIRDCPSTKAVVELLVSDRVPDIIDHVLSVHRVFNGNAEKI